MATSTNAELVEMCGPRDPGPGELRVVKAVALADAEKNFVVIMQDGVIYRSTL